jgi:DNA replication and repair protein RecF
MPTINSLSITNFRNLTSVNIKPSSSFNVFYGDNGAGKTSFLEAIYFLGLGKSFRSSNINRIIQHDADSFSIFAIIENDQQQIPLGMQRSRNGSRHIKFDGESIQSLAPIAKQIPLLLISTMSYRFFHDGPKIRRQFLDWGLFHVEPSFYSLWQRLQRILKQRNMGLKSHLPSRDIAAWNLEFVEAAEAIDQLRVKLTTKLEPILLKQLNILMPELDFSLRYQRGWSKEESLLQLLENNFHRDNQLGYTYYGPQRADLQLLCQKVPAQDVLSQGQQKLSAYALQLSQGMLLKQETGNTPIYFIDDLPSELDNNKRVCVTKTLQSLGAQVFITGIELEDLRPLLNLNTIQLFHVEHGTVCVKKRHQGSSIKVQSVV